MHSIFPLADDFFPTLSLGAQQLLRLRTEADKLVQQALTEFDASARQETEMLPCKSKHSANISVSAAFGQLRGHHGDLTRSLLSQTRDEYFTTHKTLFSSTSDAVVLHSIPPIASSLHTSEAINWASYDMFPLEGRADSCHYEATGERVDRRGRPYTFHVVVPAELSEVPNQLNTVRVFATRVVIARPCTTDPNACDVLATTHTDFRSRYLCRNLHKQFQLSLRTISASVDPQRTATQWAIFRNEWVPRQLPTACTVCSSAFSMLRVKHNCAVCRQIVCRKCLVRASEVMNTHATRYRRKAAPAKKLCLPCIELLREGKQNAALSLPVVLTTVNNNSEKRGLGVCFPSNCVTGMNPRSVPTPTATRMTCDDGWDRPRQPPRNSPSSLPGPRAVPDYVVYDAPQDEDDVIQVEDDVAPEELHQEGFDVLFTIDTSDMARAGHGSPRLTQTTPRGSLFQDISASLQEQVTLLQQLRAHTADWYARSQAV